jgi:thymidine kinase
MFSGKTTELIRRIDQARDEGRIAFLFKPSVDDRHGKLEIATHDGISRAGVSIEPGSESIHSVRNLIGAPRLASAHVFGFDETNFFSSRLPRLCEDLMRLGKRVVTAGLDYDFARRPFGPTLRLAEMATVVTLRTSVCEICGRTAAAYQRIIDGRPAPIDGPLIMVGGREIYQARCLECYLSEREASSRGSEA